MRGPRVRMLTLVLLLCMALSPSAICVADDAVAQSKGTCATGAATPEPSTPANSALATPIGALGGGGAGGQPGLRIASLVARADTIVRGTVESVAEVGDGVLTVARGADGYVSPVELGEGVEGQGGLSPNSYPVTVCRVGFKVTASVKGPVLPPGATITVESYRPHLGPAWGLLEAGQHGLLLLDDNGALADLYYPLLPVAPDVPVMAGDVPPLDAIKEYLLLSMKPGVTEETLASCIEGAIDLHLQAAGDALVPLTRDNDPKIVGRALAGLVHFQDARAFPEAVEFILHPPQTAQVQALMVMCSVGMLTDPELAEAIIPLLSSADATCRRQALSALRHMKDPRNMPTLAAALSDADLENRYIAVMGLAETTGRWNAEWATSWPKFQGNPSYYVDKWLNWWEGEGKAQYGSSAP